MNKSFLIICLIFPLSLFCFPITDYNFRLPSASLSAYEASLGGICITNAENPFAIASNPALMSDVKKMTMSASFYVPSKERSFTEIVKTNPILQKSYFRGLSVQAKGFGLLYQELANDQIDKKNRFFTKYQNYTLRSFGFAIADTSFNTSWGVSLKYLNGRLVYNKQLVQDTLLIGDEFIDSNANGFASDLGFYSKTGSIHYAAVVHDLYSKLYWKDYKTEKIKTRLTTSVEFRTENIALTSAATSLWNIHEKPIYCQSFQYFSQVSTPSSNQSIGLRFGASSSTFDKSENILFGLGTAYYIDNFKVELSLQSQGWILANSQYMLNFCFGE